MQRFLQLRQQQQQQGAPQQSPAAPQLPPGLAQQLPGFSQQQQQPPQGMQQHTNPLALLHQQSILRRQEQEQAFQGPRPSTAGSGSSSTGGSTGRARGQAAGLAAAAAAAAVAQDTAQAEAGASASGRISARSSPQRLAATQFLSQGRTGVGPAAAFATTFTNPLALESADSDGGSTFEEPQAAAAARPEPAAAGHAAPGNSPFHAAAAAVGDQPAAEHSPFHAAAQHSPFGGAAQQGWASSEIVPDDDRHSSGLGLSGLTGRSPSGSAGLGQRAGSGRGSTAATMGGRRGGFRRPVSAAGSLSTATSLAAPNPAGSLSTATSLAAPHAAGSLSPAASLAASLSRSRLAAEQAPHPAVQPLSAHPRRHSPLARAGSGAASMSPAASATTAGLAAGLAAAAASDDGEALEEFAAACGAYPDLPASPGRSGHSLLSQPSAARASYTFMPWDTVSRFEGQVEAAAEAAEEAATTVKEAAGAGRQQDGSDAGSGTQLGRSTQLASTGAPSTAQPGHTASQERPGGSPGAGFGGSLAAPQAGEQQVPPVELRPPAALRQR